MDHGVVEEVAQDDADGVDVRPGKEFGKPAVVEAQTVPDIAAPPVLVGQQPQHGHEVDPVAAQGQPRLGPGQLKQLFDQVGEAAQGRGDLLGALPVGRAGEPGGQALGLGQGRGDRRAQLVGAVGREGPLALERPAETPQQAIHVADDGRQLLGQRALRDRREIRAAAPADLLSQLGDGPGRLAHGQADRKAGQRHQDQERRHQPEEAVAYGRRPVRQGLGDLNEQAAAERRLGVEAPPLGLVEAGAQGDRKGGGGRVVGADQHPARRVAHLIGQVLLVLGHQEAVVDQAPAVVIVIVVIVLAALVEIVSRQRQEALGGFLQRAVEGLVDLVAHDQCRDHDREQPQAAQRERQPGDQPPRNAPAHGTLGHDPSLRAGSRRRARSG